MKYVSYRGTPYEKKITIPEHKRFGGKSFELADVFPNYGGHDGHRNALGLALQFRNQGCLARAEAHSGYSAVYVCCAKKRR